MNENFLILPEKKSESAGQSLDISTDTKLVNLDDLEEMNIDVEIPLDLPEEKKSFALNLIRSFNEKVKECKNKYLNIVGLLGVSALALTVPSDVTQLASSDANGIEMTEGAQKNTSIERKKMKDFLVKTILSKDSKTEIFQLENDSLTSTTNSSFFAEKENTGILGTDSIANKIDEQVLFHNPEVEKFILKATHDDIKMVEELLHDISTSNDPVLKVKTRELVQLETRLKETIDIKETISDIGKVVNESIDNSSEMNGLEKIAVKKIIAPILVPKIEKSIINIDNVISRNKEVFKELIEDDPILRIKIKNALHENNDEAKEEDVRFELLLTAVLLDLQQNGTLDDVFSKIKIFAKKDIKYRDYIYKNVANNYGSFAKEHIPVRKAQELKYARILHDKFLSALKRSTHNNGNEIITAVCSTTSNSSFKDFISRFGLSLDSFEENNR